MNTPSPEVLHLDSPHSGAPVPVSLLVPPGATGPLPLVIGLHGGGSSHMELHAITPLLHRWWARGLPPCAIAMPGTTPFSYFLDEPGGAQWEQLVLSLPQVLAADHPVRVDPAGVALVGMSMGGASALRIAAGHPHRFRAVAALNPMVEPAVRPSDVPARNRLHWPMVDTPLLYGPDADPAFFRASHPAQRFRDNAQAVRAARLEILLDTGDSDVLNAHDGTEWLHRVLWDLDLPHAYRLVRGADHLGPHLAIRLEGAHRWIAERLVPVAVSTDPELTALHQALASARAAAALRDPDANRHLGRLPEPDTRPARQGSRPASPAE